MSIKVCEGLQDGIPQHSGVSTNDSAQKICQVFQSAQLEQREKEIQEIMKAQPGWPKEAAVAIYQKKQVIKVMMTQEGLTEAEAQEKYSRNVQVEWIMKHKGVSREVAEAEYDAF